MATAALWCLPLVSIAACYRTNIAGQDDETRDAAVDDGRPSNAGARDAGPDPEFRSLLVELLAQYDRQSEARCPCQVDDGDFASHDECIAKIGGRSRSSACAAKALAGDDGTDLRAMLRCQIEECRRANECLESSSCADLEVGACLQRPPDCPMLDPQLLTRLLRACPDLVLLSRP